MHRIDDPSAVASIPTPRQPGTPGFFTQGSPTTGQEATIVSDDWANATQEEICYVIEQAGLILSKVDRTQLYQAIGLLTRRRLTANTIFYVSPSGNDSNDGLTMATPWATITHAYTYIRDRIDGNGYSVTIQLMNGTHAAAYCAYPSVSVIPVINGNNADPSQVTVNNPNGAAICAAQGGVVMVQNFTVTAAGPEGDYGAVGSGLLANAAPSVIAVGDGMRFGTCNTAHIQTYEGGTVSATKSGLAYSVVGGGERHYYANGGYVTFPDAHVTILNTPAFSVAFAQAQSGGSVAAWNITFAGSGATGPRYNALMGGIINTANAGPNYFPGNAAGTVDATSYGVYR